MSGDEPFQWGLTPSKPQPPEKPVEPAAAEPEVDAVLGDGAPDDATQSFTPFFDPSTGGAPMVDAGAELVDHDTPTEAYTPFFDAPIPAADPTDRPSDPLAEDLVATQTFPPVRAFTPVSMPATPPGGEELHTVALAAAGSDLDALFGTDRFQEYPVGPPVASAETQLLTTNPGEHPPSHTESRAPRPLLVVAASVLALLTLFALFMLGTRIPAWTAAPPAPTPSTTPTPTPTPTPIEVVGPHALGDAAWNELGGGECIDPWVSVWELTFTVVDCAAAHPAQLVYRGTFDPGDYPGEKALSDGAQAACTSAGAIDLAAAAAFTDIVVVYSYPASAVSWEQDGRHFYCFITRSSGQPLTGSLAAATQG